MGRWQDAKIGTKASLAVATGFGFGLSPFASGTVGTLWGFIPAWFLSGLAWPWQTGVALALAAAAIPFCGIAEAWFGKKDDGRIVADEYLTFPLAVIGLPLQQEPLLLLFAFLSARFMDIVKPWPARGLQSLHGGFGIVIDDVIASLYALAVNWLFFLFVYPACVDVVARFWPF